MLGCLLQYTASSLYCRNSLDIVHTDCTIIDFQWDFLQHDYLVPLRVVLGCRGKEHARYIALLLYLFDSINKRRKNILLKMKDILHFELVREIISVCIDREFFVGTGKGLDC